MHKMAYNDYLLLCELCSDDVNTVAKLMQAVKNKNYSAVKNGLENLKIMKYQNEISMILDNLQLGAFQNLHRAFSSDK